jgi:hypothetical protein
MLPTLDRATPKIESNESIQILLQSLNVIERRLLMRVMTKVQYRAISIVLAIMLAAFGLAETTFAQAPQPTAVPPAGSNPQFYAPTDVPIDLSLFWMLMFFVVLAVGLIASNFLTRSRFLSDQVDQPADAQPEAGK